jgi:zinc transport system substrate-binding protein
MKTGRLILAFVLIVIIAIATSLLLGQQRNIEGTARLIVVATIFPVYDFTRAIGGDRISIFMLLPPGAEAHSYEPRPSDIGLLSSADLFIYSSKNMEPWASDIIAGIRNNDLILLEAGANVPILLDNAEEGLTESDTHFGEKSSGKDPHIWLDMLNAEIMIKDISKALASADPVNEDYYTNNAEEYISVIKQLDVDFASAIGQCKKKVLVHGGHYAFGYLASRYGIKYIAAQGFSPDSEPGPAQIIQLIKVMKEYDVSYIFYEELIEPKVAKSISKETGAEMIMLHAGHNISKDEFDSGRTFTDLMRINLESLKLGLEYDGK